MHVADSRALRFNVLYGPRRLDLPNLVPLVFIQLVACLARQVFIVAIKEVPQLLGPSLVCFRWIAPFINHRCDWIIFAECAKSLHYIRSWQSLISDAPGKLGVIANLCPRILRGQAINSKWNPLPTPMNIDFLRCRKITKQHGNGDQPCLQNLRDGAPSMVR